MEGTVAAIIADESPDQSSVVCWFINNGFIAIDATRISAICIENVCQQDRIVGLRCLHVFHSTCLNQVALSGFRECPLCQQPIMPMSGEAGRNLSEDDPEAAQFAYLARLDRGVS